MRCEILGDEMNDDETKAVDALKRALNKMFYRRLTA